jgi:hypothetical protein
MLTIHEHLLSMNFHLWLQLDRLNVVLILVGIHQQVEQLRREDERIEIHFENLTSSRIGT